MRTRVQKHGECDTVCAVVGEKVIIMIVGAVPISVIPHLHVKYSWYRRFRCVDPVGLGLDNS
jgi:hypothetical protein